MRSDGANSPFHYIEYPFELSEIGISVNKCQF